MGQLIRHACVSRQDASLGRAVVAHFAELTFFLFCFFFVNHSFDFRPNRIPFTLTDMYCLLSNIGTLSSDCLLIVRATKN